VEPSNVPPLAIQSFGKYKLVQRIGAGGMAEVFLAILAGPEGFQRSLVVKRMMRQLSHDSEFVGRFVEEAKMSAQLSHPNIVQVFEFGKIDDSYFIAMEWVQGRILSEIKAELATRQRQMPIAASVEIVHQTCKGLDYAHSLQSSVGKPLGIVHRDVSPHNLMLDRHGVVKILDFGIARVADELREVRTRVGTMKGKVSYMSPEQLNLHDIDHRTDIFAAGILLHELLTGHRLFRADNDYASSRMVLEGTIPPPSSMNPAVPAELDRVVMRALQRDRDLRYPSAGEMATDLEGVMRESNLPAQNLAKLVAELFPVDAAEKALRVTRSHFAVKMPPPETPNEPITSVGPPNALSASARASTPARGSGSGANAQPGGRGKRIALAGTAVAAVGLLAAIPLLRRSPREVAPAPAPVMAQPSPAAPAGQTVSLSIDSTPQDATVTPVGAAHPLGKTPLTILQPRSTQVIELRIERDGYAPVTYKIIPDLEKAVNVELVRLSPDQQPKGQPDPAAAAAHAGPHVAAAPKKPTHAEQLPVAVTDDGKPCFLTVGSFPWAQLWIDGKDSGQPTPVVHLQVPCGAHKLRFKRDDAKIDQAVSISVTADREFKRNFQLDAHDTDG
jgi:serine/threonine-protein kinase